MTADDIKLIVSIAALVFTALNFLYSRFQVQVALNREVARLATEVLNLQALEDRFNKVEGEIRENKRIMDILWGAIEDNMTKLLMHHNDPDRDVLLAKLRSRTLSYSEAIQLKAILDVDMQHGDKLTDIQAAALPWVMAAVNKAIATTPPGDLPTTPTPLPPLPPPREDRIE